MDAFQDALADLADRLLSEEEKGDPLSDKLDNFSNQSLQQHPL